MACRPHGLGGLKLDKGGCYLGRFHSGIYDGKTTVLQVASEHDGQVSVTFACHATW